MKDTKYLQPFATRFSPNVPEILDVLSCSLIISTYQAGKVIFLSSENNRLVQLPRTFPKPMGIAVSANGERLALANLSEVVEFQNNSTLAKHYPKKKNVYDAMYLPRVTYHTNPLDIHDLDWIKGELYAVNTMFSCIVKIDNKYSFTPVWQPPYVDKIISEDRCHLNGMAIVDDRIKYATAFSQSNTPRGWRDDLMNTGVLMDVEHNTILLDNLSMPHSPKWHQNKVYIALSGKEKIITYDPVIGKVENLIECSGFLRGMAFYKNYLFVAHSKLREKSSSFGQLNLKGQHANAGIYIIDLTTNSLVGQIEYLNSVEEIYDIQIIPIFKRPNIIQSSNDEHLLGLSTPDATYWGTKPKKNE